MIANLKHAARNNETVSIGGGLFTPAELLDAARRLEAFDDMLDALHRVLPFVEDAKQDPLYKPGAVRAVEKLILAAIAKGTKP